jgi:uncharacterized phage infection (PIP) family protein YhgE
MRILKAVTKVAFAYIKTYVLTVIDALVTGVRAGLALLRGDWKKAGKIILGFVKRAGKRIKKFANRVGEILGGLAESALDWAKDLVKKFVAGLSAKKKAFTEKLGKLKQKVTDKIGGLAKAAKRWGKDLIAEFVAGINSKIAQFKQKVNELEDAVKKALSFDRVKNDRMAQRWGADLVDHFSRGMARKSGQLQSALPSQQPGSFGLQAASGTGSGTTVNVTVEAGAVQMRGGSTARVNAQKTAEGVADEFAQRFGRRS